MMKKILLIALCFVFVFLSLSACSDVNKKNQGCFLLDIKELTQEKVCEILGESSGSLHGARGQVYLLENMTKINIYFNNDEIVQSLSIENKVDVVDINDFIEFLKKTTQEEVHRMLGKPSGALHGARGDVYILDNKTKITIYYNMNGLVKDILITNKDDKETFTTM